MKDIASLAQNITRPRLLIRAARFGLENYQRDKHLRRYFGYGALPRSGPALMQLLDRESGFDRQRRAGEAGYSIARHVDLLIAIMGEARLLRAPLPDQSG